MNMFRRLICALCALGLACSAALGEASWKENWFYIIALRTDPLTYLVSDSMLHDGSYVWSRVDAQGNMLEEHMFDDFEEEFEDGVAIVYRDDLYGYLLDTGEWLIEPKFYSASGFEDGLARIRTQDNLCGIIDRSGSFVVEPEYVGIGDFSPEEGLASVRTKDGLYGYIDKSGNLAVEAKYTAANDFHNGYASVAVGGTLKEDDVSGAYYENLRWGLIDADGNVVLPFEYDEIGAYEDDYGVGDDGTFVATKDGQEKRFLLTEDGAREIAEVGSELLLSDYMPFEGSKVATLDGAPTLEPDSQAIAVDVPIRASEDFGYPRLDGATALFPVYAAFAQALYPDDTRYTDPDDADEADDALITCTKTNRAYERLVEGKADVIFCAGPSDAQIEAARAAGVEFELTPFGKEAFVFIVNAENPLENITIEQIRSVYSGKITQWKELGVEDLGEIIAYQRPKDSGSQTALERLMGDTPLMEAPQLVEWDMGDIITTIEYRNLPNAIGYSFRFFCTEMAGSEVKLLSVDGVSPTLENIRSGAYPITTTLYAVTRKGEENPNVRALVDWVASDPGQELVERSGYVGYVEG